MTLRDYVKIFRQRWWVIVVCALVGGGVMFVITPAKASDQAPTRSYTATATLLVGSVEGGGGMNHYAAPMSSRLTGVQCVRRAP